MIKFILWMLALPFIILAAPFVLAFGFAFMGVCVAISYAFFFYLLTHMGW